MVCFILYAAVGPSALLGLLILFILTWASTRAGRATKEKSGIAERSDGRTASQVLANLGISAVCALLYLGSGSNPVFLVSLCAALSEAAADTVSSELGKISSHQARLITSWRSVPSGTDGGVSLAGSLAGTAAATVVTLVFFSARPFPAGWAKISILTAVLGMIADSFLGAVFERRKLLNNNAVNFLSTAIAASGAALWLWYAA